MTLLWNVELRKYRYLLDCPKVGTKFLFLQDAHISGEGPGLIPYNMEHLGESAEMVCYWSV